MKKILISILIFYYTAGAICLPLGDFSILPNLPKMYHHCKQTEDCDMDVVDFITDHLINLDSIFDDHAEGDDQKPHQPYPYQNYSLVLFIKSVDEVLFEVTHNNIKIKREPIISGEQLHTSNFTSKHFKPPIV